jgi:hypothetical protein
MLFESLGVGLLSTVDTTSMIAAVICPSWVTGAAGLSDEPAEHRLEIDDL